MAATHADALELLRAEIPPRVYAFAEYLASDPELKPGVLERAAAHAGAPGKHAELLRDPRTARVLQAIRGSDSDALKDTRRNALLMLQTLCAFDPADVFHSDGHSIRSVHDIPPAARAAITSIRQRVDGTLEIRFCSRLDALKLLFQHFGDLDGHTFAVGGTAIVHFHGRTSQ